MTTAITKISQSFSHLYDAFVTLGRLTTLQVLNEGQLKNKHILISKAAEFIEVANQISVFLNRVYALKSHLIAWHEYSHPIHNQFFNFSGIEDQRIEDFKQELFSAVVLQYFSSIEKNVF